MPPFLARYRSHLLIGIPFFIVVGAAACRYRPSPDPRIPLAEIGPGVGSNSPVSPPANAVGQENALPDGTGQPPPAPGGVPAGITVHVAGCVRKPGVYTFTEGARVNDAVKAAGGAKAGADLDAVNLAARIQDGAQVFLPSKSATQERAMARASGRAGGARRFPRPSTPPGPPGRMEFTPPATIQPLDPPPAQGRPAGGSAGPARPEKLHSAAEGRVNINRADSAELQRLPHVGPATAEKILEYRKAHGPFRSVEDLLEVRGIGEKRLAEIRDLIEL